MPLYLASRSPRRIAFLAELGLQATCIMPPEHAEPSPFGGEAPQAFAMRAASAKADSVTSILPSLAAGHGARHSAAILAADTIVVLDREILGKPETPEHALVMLSRLAGATHTVITGCAVLPLCEGVQEAGASPACSADPPLTFFAQSRVRMWDCPKSILERYARCGEPMDKAGAYAIQGAGAFLVQEIQGSWSNVVGLPLAELVQALLTLKLIAPS